MNSIMIRIFIFLSVGLSFTALHAQEVAITGLTVRRADRNVYLSWKANVKNAEFRIYRGYVPLKDLRAFSNAILIAQLHPEGEPDGKLFRFTPFTDTLYTDSPAYYLILPEKDEFVPSDFRADQNFNTRPAGVDSPAPSPAKPEPSPKTPEEILIEETPEGLRIRVSAIRFALGRAEISADSETTLAKVTDVIRKIIADPQTHGLGSAIRIEVGGHTDDVGSPAANLGLSQRRALSVRNDLVRRGLDKTLFSVKGYGDTRPVRKISRTMSDEEKAESRAFNRRVELFIKK